MAIQLTVLLTKNLYRTPKIPQSNTHIPNLSLNPPPSLFRLFSSQNSELKKKNKQQLALKNGVVKCSLEYNNNNNVNNGQYYEYERHAMGQPQYPRPSEIEWKKEICNSVQLIGIVGTPVQIKHLTSGKVLAWSRLAVKKSSTDTAW